MFAECTETSKGECLLSVLKVVKMNVYWVYWNLKRWMLAECTQTGKDESLPITLKLEKMNVCWVYWD